MPTRGGGADSTMVVSAAQETTSKRSRLAVIDCDIHNALPSERALGAYLPDRWRRHHDVFGTRGYSGLNYPFANLNAARTDSWPPSGLPPGADRGFMRQQLLDRWNLEYGILMPLLGVGRQLNLAYAAARARAVNDWQIAEWLEP